MIHALQRQHPQRNRPPAISLHNHLYALSRWPDADHCVVRQPHLLPRVLLWRPRQQRKLATARRHAAEQGVEVTFESGDVYALGYDDASFDVVHAHQVLQHLSNPVAALKEMRRVTRPGGIVAVRDGDYSCFSWAPLDPRLDRWQELYRAVARKNGGEPDAGRFLKRWALEAGFSDMRVSSSTWTFADSESCRWWGALWADRCDLSAIVSRLLGSV